MSRPVRIVAGAAAAVVALSFLFAARPPGTEIRDDLSSAADVLHRLPSNASPARITGDLRSALRGQSARVDPSGFPTSVAVTLQGLDWRSCVAVQRVARRLEGQVVVELQGYASSSDCRDSNDMTWRLMP